VNEVWSDAIHACVAFVPVLEASSCTASYDDEMEPSKIRQKVVQALSRPGHGETAEEVLTGCRLVAEAELNLSNEELDSLQREISVSKQTWKRMISVSRNLLLWENRGVMPGNLSSLYRLSLLKPATLRQGLNDKKISSEITTREIEALKRKTDIQSRFRTSKHSIFLFCNEELDNAVFAELLSRINRIASEYNACFDTQNLAEIQKENNRKLFDIRRQFIESRIRDEIQLVTSPAARQDGIQINDNEREILSQLPIDISFGDFVKTIKKLSKNREEMMRVYGRVYCLKLAQEYWNTESRSQRYNCKRRLMEVEKMYPFLGSNARLVHNTLLRIEDDCNSTDEVNPETLLEEILSN
jgi:hypothetical protein